MLIARLFTVASAVVGLVSAAPKKKVDTKYFHEPGRGDLTGHYDIRYFREIVDYDTRLDTLQHMVRAWLQTTENLGIETWIAHGTLLGWWWNAKLLPWDWDLDVQVHTDTLQMMGKKYNLTRHSYLSEDKTVKREYLLDVNAWAWERVRGDGNNIIDARWIDTRNGLFIDITGIAETDPKRPGILSCKNNHHYRYTDIWPLRDTIFEGVKAKIPYNFDDILVEEYHPKALVTTEFEGHRWNIKTRQWELAADVPNVPLKRPRIPEKYSKVETGGFFHNLYRLVHWW